MVKASLGGPFLNVMHRGRENIYLQNVTISKKNKLQFQNLVEIVGEKKPFADRFYSTDRT